MPTDDDPDPTRHLQTGRTGTIVLGFVLFILGPAIGVGLIWWCVRLFGSG